MESVVFEWLRTPPYTSIHRRLKPLIMLFKLLVPSMSYTKIRSKVFAATETLLNGELGRIWMRDRCVRRTIRVYGANDQRTDQWHAKRGEMITASEVADVFAGGESRRRVILRKLEPPSSSASASIPALIWGTRFEPIAKSLYEEETDCTITDVSCVQHPIYPFLGASPDGILFPNDRSISNQHRIGRLIEFKCPISRPESVGIPEGYVHQMQLQMECTGIDECEYVEFRFKQVFSSEWVRSSNTKGVFAVFDSGRVNYKPMSMDLAEWQTQMNTEDEPQFIYWIILSTKKAFLPKDPQWLSSHLDELKSTWNEVLLHRAAGTLPSTTITSKVVTLDI